MMAIFLTGLVIGLFLYVLGKALEFDERQALARREREERERRWRGE